jgi:hypothetical protein
LKANKCEDRKECKWNFSLLKNEKEEILVSLNTICLKTIAITVAIAT